MQECSLDRVENIKEACNDAFYSAEGTRDKILLDPLNPLGSLTSGNQQFTIIADTEHGNPAASGITGLSVPSMAQAGVKHLMLEMFPTPELQEVMGRLYQNPPQITENELVEKAHLFEFEGDNESDIIKNSVEYALMIHDARHAGIQVHFVNDEAGYAELEELRSIEGQQEALLQTHPKLQSVYAELNIIAQEQQKLFEDNAGLKEFMESTITMDDLGEGLYNELTEEGKALFDQAAALEERIGRLYEGLDGDTKLADQKYSQLTNKWIEVDADRTQARMGVEVEEARADKFINLAGGEKAAVIFGADHMGGIYDLNEAIDTRLQQEAFQNGRADSFVETKVFATYESREAYHSMQNLTGTDTPDVLYFADENEALITQEGAHDIEMGVHTNDMPSTVQAPVQQFSGFGN